MILLGVLTFYPHAFERSIYQPAYQDLKMRVKKAIPMPYATAEWYIKAVAIMALSIFLEYGTFSIAADFALALRLAPFSLYRHSYLACL